MIKDTQRAAFHALQNLPAKRRSVLGFIARTGGATLFEIVRGLKWPINRVSGRVSELAKAGLVEDSGARRVNPESKRAGIVWTAKDQDPQDQDGKAK